MNAHSKCFMILLLLLPLVSCDSVDLIDPNWSLQLQLTSDKDGGLKQITLDQQDLGNDDFSYQKLNSAVAEFVTAKAKTKSNERQVDFSADEHLRFEFVHRAIEVCAGRPDEKAKNWNSRIEKFRLIMPKSDPVSATPHQFFVYVQPQFGVDHYDDIPLPDIQVRLTANADGSLNMLKLGRRELGNDGQAFERLNYEILKIIGKPGNLLTQDVELEIDADKQLQYKHIIQAVKSCSGRLARNQWIVYVEKIKFAGIGGTREPLGPIQELDMSIEVEESGNFSSIMRSAAQPRRIEQPRSGVDQ